MQLKTGEIVEGRVVKIASFGAFVQLEPRINGLVHISEISKNFVADISSFLEVGDTIKVKILNNSDGKLSLSIKQVQELKPKVNEPKHEPSLPKKTKKSSAEPPVFCSNMNEKTTSNTLSFEEMLSRFKKSSEEKLSNLKRKTDNRRSSYSRRR